MKLHYAPTVYLVVRPDIHYGNAEQFLIDSGAEDYQPYLYYGAASNAGGQGDVIPEVAGRVCYMSFAKPRPGGNQAYLENIKSSGHGSVLEHPSWSFIFTGISRTLTHELVRHRAGWAYSQLSQRYVDESVAEYVVPHDLREEVQAAEDYQLWVTGFLSTSGGTAEEASQAFYRHRGTHKPLAVATGLDWLAGMSNETARYRRMVDYLADRIGKTTDLKGTDLRKAARQAARSVLPNATETKIFATANGRALRHFIEMRASRHAEPEIRKLAIQVLTILQTEAPNLFGDYTINDLPDGTQEATTPFRKV